MVAADRLFIWLPEKPFLEMLHTDGGKMSSRREFSHRPQPSSLDNRVLIRKFITVMVFKYNGSICNIINHFISTFVLNNDEV